ncbi:hypothetical protein RHMOL_Rhmol04G0316800 [Rhododendron molle]|uniref:Uncharacterized protein n=1 Tax=Rhododendron molle TaxID=49168 RepID=A0ACC0P7N3_RHOML|nr:hypothetical protein RHMOL_Rhmol04G0316800 [Rhododendron molle]
MRPIEGLTLTVDIDRQEVVKISNTRRGIPVPKSANTDYRYVAQAKAPEMEPINPISIEQPNGPSYRVEDRHTVRWANWVFHLKPDQRAGMIISRATVRDSETGEPRSVMYKGFASELFVPYMDPDEAWYFKSYMDEGEFGLGADGSPYVQPNMICLFERFAGYTKNYGPVLKLRVNSLELQLPSIFVPIRSVHRCIPKIALAAVPPPLTTQAQRSSRPRCSSRRRIIPRRHLQPFHRDRWRRYHSPPGGCQAAGDTPVLIVIVASIEHWYTDQILGALNDSGVEEGAADPFLDGIDQILTVAVESLCDGLHRAADAAPEADSTSVLTPLLHTHSHTILLSL